MTASRVVCLCVQVCANAYEQRSEEDMGVLLSLRQYSFEIESLDLELDWQPTASGPSCPWLPQYWSVEHTSTCGFKWVPCVNAGPHAYATRLLSLGHIPSSTLKLFLMRCLHFVVCKLYFIKIWYFLFACLGLGVGFLAMEMKSRASHMPNTPYN